MDDRDYSELMHEIVALWNYAKELEEKINKLEANTIENIQTAITAALEANNGTTKEN